MNANAVASEKKFPNNWNTITRKAPLNYSFSFSVGDQTKLFKRTLGFIIGLRYSSSYQYDPNSIKNNYEYMLGQPDTYTSKLRNFRKPVRKPMVGAL